LNRPAGAILLPQVIPLGVRPLQAADGPALRQACFPGASAGEIDQAVAASLARTRAGRGVYLVVEWGGEIVGSGQLVPWGQDAEIADLVVAPAFRRRGVGQALLIALLDAARSRGCRTVEIGADCDNEAALSLYRQLGFVDRQTVRLQIEGVERTLVYLARIP
jgi:ribosomal protein S18 acetylase RimI-like enzyme